MVVRELDGLAVVVEVTHPCEVADLLPRLLAVGLARGRGRVRDSVRVRVRLGARARFGFGLELGSGSLTLTLTLTLSVGVGLLAPGRQRHGLLLRPL